MIAVGEDVESVVTHMLTRVVLVGLTLVSLFHTAQSLFSSKYRHFFGGLTFNTTRATSSGEASIRGGIERDGRPIGRLRFGITFLPSSSLTLTQGCTCLPDQFVGNPFSARRNLPSLHGLMRGPGHLFQQSPPYLLVYSTPPYDDTFSHRKWWISVVQFPPDSPQSMTIKDVSGWPRAFFGPSLMVV